MNDSATDIVTPSASVVPRFESESRQIFLPFPVDTQPLLSRWGLPEWFAVAQVAGPALFYLPGSQLFRAPLRIGVFALSLMGVIWCVRRSRSTRVHPACIPLLIAALYMTIMIFHPATNTVMAGLAQIGMHGAVAAPLFWAPHYFRGDDRRLLRVLTIFWVLNGASAVVGILQVRDPATWMPAEFSRAIVMAHNEMSMYEYKKADGTIAIRPPGLGDNPGAACGAGLFVALAGLAFLGLPVSPLRKLVGSAMGMAGIIVIFLSHVRSALVVAAGCAIIYSIIMIVQRRLKSVIPIVLCVVISGVAGTFYAERYGGKSTMERFATLLAEDPMTVYSKSQRLQMITEAFDTTLLEYPLGAGLGRWGMMRRYFGNESNTDSPELG